MRATRNRRIGIDLYDRPRKIQLSDLLDMRKYITHGVGFESAS